MGAIVRLVVAGLVAFTSGAAPAAAAGSIVVQSAAVEPPVLRTTIAERVEFVNQTGRAVHVQFEGDARDHEVIQIPTTGPFWVVFHRTGVHRYVVHVYEPKERTLSGTVEVTEDPRRAPEPAACAVTVMGVCIER